LNRLHACYGTLAVRATQAKPTLSQLSKSRASGLGACVFCSPGKCYVVITGNSEVIHLQD
jgi:hypothetical protein